MKKNNKTLNTGCVILSIACAVMLSVITAACKSVDNSKKLTNLPLIEDTEFGGAYIGTTTAQLKEAGFDFGDSVNITFSDGREVKDIPYYSGYNNKTGEYLLCGYPGYEHPQFTRNNFGEVWNLYGLTEKMQASITMNEKGKYLAVEEALSLVYSNNINDFDSEETFANFRPMKAGMLKENTVYRSASPCDNKYSRAECTHNLVEKAGIQFVLNLADNEEKFNKHLSNTEVNIPYVEKLNSEGKIAKLGLTSNYHSEVYAEKLGNGFKKMLNSDGPYLVHCTEGKDRTGFVCFLIEALCQASYEEMKADYMITYKNYYGLTEEGSPDKYNAVVQSKFDDFVTYLTDAATIEETVQSDLGNAARNYLVKCGLTLPEIESLVSKLTK